MTPALLPHATAIAERLTRSGVEAEALVVGGHAAVMVALSHDATAIAWCSVATPSSVIEQHGGATPVIAPYGVLDDDIEPCGEVGCLALSIWLWVLRRRAELALR